MKDGFVKVKAVSLPVVLGNCQKNAETILAAMKQAAKEGVKVLCLQELGLTGCTCGDLFAQRTLQKAAEKALAQIVRASAPWKMVTVVGAPLTLNGILYNCAVVLCGGHILGIVPKSHPDARERRCFAPAPWSSDVAELFGQEFPFGADLIFRCRELPELAISCEIGRDACAPVTPAIRHALAGATVICHPTAEDFSAPVYDDQADRLLCARLTAGAGAGESTTDLVYCGYACITERDEVLGECTEIDVQSLADARRASGFFSSNDAEQTQHEEFLFSLPETAAVLTRAFDTAPFVTYADCAGILDAQAMGLAERMVRSYSKTAVLGLSGGLDSTLALLVAVKAFEKLGRPRTDILVYTMPCFGTTARTKSNAEKMAECLGVSFDTVRIADSVSQHFRDIGLDAETDRSAAFENGQARERTQVLMDIANLKNGLVIGTGDLSELALGWCTYNGDHMSMYAVNGSVPKTLVRALVRYYADHEADETLAAVLRDVLDTPVSPELLPPKEGEIEQKTEDLIGPYELHDFFLYHALANGFGPAKIFRIAKAAFAEDYDAQTILKWLKTFFKRFFSQQFKRSCMPDGPKVTPVSLSPRGVWQMPSDITNAAWQAELELL